MIGWKKVSRRIGNEELKLAKFLEQRPPWNAVERYATWREIGVSLGVRKTVKNKLIWYTFG